MLNTVVLYGCETWSLTLREENRLGAFENRVMRRIFEPKRDGVTREWGKLHNEEMGGACSTNGREEECVYIVGWEAKGRRPLGRPRRRWLDNIRMDLVEVGWSDVDRIGLAQERQR
jgi:hypothetical protein